MIQFLNAKDFAHNRHMLNDIPSFIAPRKSCKPSRLPKRSLLNEVLPIVTSRRHETLRRLASPYKNAKLP